GRRGGQNSVPPHDDRKLPEKYARELAQCLELGGSANRDAEALTAVLANQKPAVAQHVASAVEQLIKSTRGLSERVNHIGSEAKLPLPKIEPSIKASGETTPDADATTATAAGTSSSDGLNSDYL